MAKPKAVQRKKQGESAKSAENNRRTEILSEGTSLPNGTIGPGVGENGQADHCPFVIGQLVSFYWTNRETKVKTKGFGMVSGVGKSGALVDQILPQKATVEVPWHYLHKEDWTPPRYQELPTALPFPVDVFPPKLQRFCREVSEAMLAPTDFAGVSIIDDGGRGNWPVGQHQGQVWLDRSLRSCISVLVAPPGKTKSPVIRAVVRPLAEIDERLREQSKKDWRAWQNEGAEGKRRRPWTGAATASEDGQGYYSRGPGARPGG